MSTDPDKHEPSARALFDAYLQDRAHRKTPERFAILEEVRRMPAHFDIRALDQAMSQRNYRVSKATLYHTLDLLVACGIVSSIQFDNGQRQYECTFGKPHHDHLVCLHCGRVVDIDPIADPDRAIEAAERAHFTHTYHITHVYGLCQKCREQQKNN